MPLSLVFTPDAFYFGVLPVFAEAAPAVGQDPLEIGRAAIMGQMTTGFPISPLTASTFILLGLSGVSLRDHQRFVFLWAFGTTVVMTIVGSLTGAI
jgi:citrate-Mg2+:H+ or citrate-Ca2+:H+ symporter, CitMHS family